MPARRLRATAKSRRPQRLARAPTVKSLTALIKKTALRVTETKVRTYSAPQSNLVQNEPQIIEQSLTSVPQGVGDTSRIGDQINVKGLRMRIMIISNVDHPNLMYKLAVVKTPIINSTVLPYTYNTWFRPITTVWPLDSFNTDLITVVSTRSGKIKGSTDYSIETGSSQKECVNFINWYLPMKDLKVDYSTDAGLYPKNFSYQLMVMAYDTFSTLSIDNVGKVKVAWDIIFKDP